MKSKRFAVAFAALLASIAVAPAAAVPGDDVDECRNADKGPGDGGPPGFVGGLVDSVTPDFLSDLFVDLPVPGFVKGFFGAESGC
ncbi:histidine kinase [Halobacteriales archaeon QS_1_67_19]|nr:MAG: histidine kinase [Halobacteriales archaeon QS_1_67_19]